MARRYLFTSESVTEGHPDKICDQISDAVLDAILAKDPQGRVACETTASTGLIHIMGEITTSCYVDIAKIARDVVRDIGYDRAKYGFDCDTCGIITNIDEQSGDIALGVDKALENKQDEAAELQNGAGDQGMMFGYACDETPELMPLPIALAHQMAKRLTEVRKLGLVNYLRPDGKTQVTVEYEDGRPVRVDAVVLSTQHSAEVTLEQIRQDMVDMVIRTSVPAELMDEMLALGAKRVLLYGSCGVLDASLTAGRLILPTAACRDEGTSYHYLPPADYVDIPTAERLGEIFDELGLPYVKGRVWTTDAIYRETRANVEKRRADGCIAVDMECASAMAVGRFRSAEVYQFLYAEDSLDGSEWDARTWGAVPASDYEKYLRVALEAAARL